MSVTAASDGSAVLITVEVGAKRARVRVTPEYARRLALELTTAADAVSPDDLVSVTPEWLRAMAKMATGR